MCVMAGLIQVMGHIFKPSTRYHAFYSARMQSSPLITVMNPSILDNDFDPYLRAFRQPPVVFMPKAKRSTVDGSERYVFLNLDWEDVYQLNQFSAGHPGLNIGAVALFRALQSDMVTAARFLGAFEYPARVSSPGSFEVVVIPSSTSDAVWNKMVVLATE